MQARPLQGAFVDPRLKHLMKELGDAINQTMSSSEPIAEVIERIKQEGYDIFLVLEATVGFSRKDDDEVASEQPAAVSVGSGEPQFIMNAQDVRFLKSLRISAEDDDELAA
jgi:hypothetical protein